MITTIERIGVGKSKLNGAPVLFHRVRIKLSRKYLVWPVAGDDRHLTLDPSQWMDGYEIVQQYKPERTL